MAEIKKSADMPKPQVIDYWKFYKATPMFIKDLNTVLAEIAYVDAVKFFDKLAENDNVLTSAELNEFIRNMSNLPYRYVKDIIPILMKAETFKLYFEETKGPANE